MQHSILIRGLAVVVLLAGCATSFAQTDEDNGSDDLFLFKPDTPSRQVRGAVIADRNGRPELGQRYLQELVESQPGSATLKELQTEFGVGLFLEMSRNPSLQPASRELLKLMNAATTVTPATAAEVESLIPTLGTDKRTTTESALRILTANNDAVAPLLAADASTKSGAIAHELLKQQSRRMRFGLVAALKDAAAEDQQRILNMLAVCRDAEVADDILPYAFSDSAAVANSANRAIRTLGGPGSANADSAADRLASKALEFLHTAAERFPNDLEQRLDRTYRDRYGMGDDPAIAPFGKSLIQRSAELSQLATKLSPNQIEVTRAASICELAQQNFPLSWPTEDIQIGSADSLPAATNEDIEVLQTALATNNSAAIFPLLTQADTALAVFAANPSLERKLLRHGDGRVRVLSAAIAEARQPGRSEIHNILMSAVRGPAKHEALVIDSRVNEAGTAAAILQSFELDARSARTGQLGFDTAVAQVQTEVIFVHSNVLRWPLSMTLANLKSDGRTKHTPVIIYGAPEHERSTRNVRAQHRGVWFIEGPIHELTLASQLRLAKLPAKILTPEERRNMARFAREAIR